MLDHNQAPAELATAAEAAAAEPKPPSKLGSLFQRLKSKKVRGLAWELSQPAGCPPAASQVLVLQPTVALFH